ncbi:hypothetical protein AHAS_Ahas13G0276500 [Arachis hypogaea]
MATCGQGRSHTQREGEDNLPAYNHTEFITAMTDLANSMQASATAKTQAMERIGQPAVNDKGTGNNLGDGVPMTLVAFLKVNLPNFKRSTNPTEVDNWFQAMDRMLKTQHVPDNQFMEFAARSLQHTNRREKLNIYGKESVDCYSNRMWIFRGRCFKLLSTRSIFQSQ